MVLDSLSLLQFLEASFGLLSAAAGIVVILLALRLASGLTLAWHKRAMRVLVAAAILVVLSELAGVLGPFFRTSTLADMVEEFAELVAISSGGVALYLISRAEREEISSLRRSANSDDLTGLSSRSFFRRAAARRIELSKTYDLPLACIVLDIDDFKAYNDLYGHQAGDSALRRLARVLRTSARADDLVARYGGEEFAVLMSGELEDALEVAERIRRRVERECAPEHDASLHRRITVSVGVVPLTGESPTLERLLEMADKEMYRAKRAGKNRVSLLEKR
jgi:diguanylate cyclase (GGDEF)-like protein